MISGFTNTYLLLAAIWLHFIGDFVMQTDGMAQNKSSSNRALTIHILVYSIPLCVLGLKFAAVNAAIHWCVDYVTSRLTKDLWKRGKVHNFFVVIGCDQAIHLTILALTIPLSYWK